MSLRESLLGIKPLPPVPVDLPDGVRVWVREMTAREADQYEAAVSAKKDESATRAALIQICCCDESGKPLFAPADKALVEALPISVATPIFMAAARANSPKAQDAAE
jgi:hypothetical protein